MLLSKGDGNFLAGFVQKMTPGVNLFTNAQDQQIAYKDLFFYELTAAAALPVSSSRANRLVLTTNPDFQLLQANGMLLFFMNGSTGLLEGCY